LGDSSTVFVLLKIVEIDLFTSGSSTKAGNQVWFMMPDNGQGELLDGDEPLKSSQMRALFRGGNHTGME